MGRGCGRVMQPGGRRGLSSKSVLLASHLCSRVAQVHRTPHAHDQKVPRHFANKIVDVENAVRRSSCSCKTSPLANDDRCGIHHPSTDGIASNVYNDIQGSTTSGPEGTRQDNFFRKRIRHFRAGCREWDQTVPPSIRLGCRSFFSWRAHGYASIRIGRQCLRTRWWAS